MREVFQRHLRRFSGKAYQVRECQISHTRYRRATRCILQYTLRLVEPSTGYERSQWVSGSMYAGDRTQRIWKKLRRSPSAWEIPDASSPFAPFFYLPDLDMLVQAFPFDRQLPALSLLMAGPPPELEPRILARFGPGDWQAEAWDIEPVQYYPEARATLRMRVRAQETATGQAEEKRFYAKVYSNEKEGEQTYQVLQALWDKASAGSEGFTVGRPVAYLSDLRTVLQEEAPGISLRNVLLYQEEGEAILTVRRVARALASLHLSQVYTPRRISLQDEATRLEKKRQSLQRACPELRSEIEEVVGAVVAGLEEVPPAPSHGELRPLHILLDGDRLALIDLDKFTGADPVRDVANLLVLLAPAVARAFVEEYFSHVPEAWRTRLPVQYAGAVVSHSAHVARRAPEDCPGVIETLVEKAKDSLAGRVW
jgi:Phosphotransferase enzyme family